MKVFTIFFCILLSFSLISSCADNRSTDFPSLSGPYLGQKPPGKTPEIFAPDIVSSNMSELNNVFTPDGKMFFFTVRSLGPRLCSMMRMVSENGIWSEPRLLPFASRYGDIDMSVSPDGRWFFFCSRRPLTAGDEPKEDNDFWMSEITAGGFGEPRHLGEDVNSPRDDYYPVFTNEENLYFSSQREGPGTNNIYVSRYVDGKFQEAKKLPETINTEYRDYDPFVSPDESYIIFASERPGGFGRSDLYISFKNDNNRWTEAVNMGGNINSAGADLCPMLSPEGKYFLYTSSRTIEQDFPERPVNYEGFKKIYDSSETPFGNIYWVSAEIIDELKQQIIK